ncbi:hypothetical protein, partial [Klebsiella pneumoniae]|uniref:hypothetical protein n=1 Tax=Klebsiella pneumoniae TaxID=573 RepID=UPI0019547AE4
AKVGPIDDGGRCAIWSGLHEIVGKTGTDGTAGVCLIPGFEDEMHSGDKSSHFRPAPLLGV